MKKTYWPALVLACLCANAGCEKRPGICRNWHAWSPARGPLVDTVDAECVQRFRTNPEPPPVPVAVPAAEPGVEARVTARLRWEKSLSDASIQVVASEGGIELKGKVAKVAQKKRAVELAESTTGVDRVTESLEVDEQSP